MKTTTLFTLTLLALVSTHQETRAILPYPGPELCLNVSINLTPKFAAIMAQGIEHVIQAGEKREDKDTNAGLRIYRTVQSRIKQHEAGVDISALTSDPTIQTFAKTLGIKAFSGSREFEAEVRNALALTPEEELSTRAITDLSPEAQKAWASVRLMGCVRLSEANEDGSTLKCPREQKATPEESCNHLLELLQNADDTKDTERYTAALLLLYGFMQKRAELIAGQRNNAFIYPQDFGK